MDEVEKAEEDQGKVLESPKPVAFTVDFGETKPVDTQRFKNLVEKYQNRHRRGQSLSKFDEPVNNGNAKKQPSTGKLPRKSGYHMEGYHSSDEKCERLKSGARSTVLNSVLRKGELTLPIKSCIGNDRMTQSYPSRSFELPVIDSPEVEIKDISSPELEPMSPMSPLVVNNLKSPNKNCQTPDVKNSTSCSSEDLSVERFESCVDFEKIDVASDTGTYTIEADNYTEEQKQRMCIDKDFNIEQVSVITKTREYIQSLLLGRSKSLDSPTEAEVKMPRKTPVETQTPLDLSKNVIQTEVPSEQSVHSDTLNNTKKSRSFQKDAKKPKDHEECDRGVFTLVTTSGVLNKRPQYKGHNRQPSLVKSVVAVETYPTTMSTNNGAQIVHSAVYVPQNIVEQRIEPKSPTETNRSINKGYIVQKNSKVESVEYMEQLPLNTSGGSSGKNSPTKIPSPIHTLKSRNRNSYCSTNDFYSDSSLETESYLKPTQNIITSLQQRLSLDSDSDDHHERKYNMPLNNEAKVLLKSKPVHVRHNSFDDKNLNKLPNKLEHFHCKNLQTIDQTLKTCNQYSHNKIVHQNSPNNSPIRRSSSLSLKNQLDNQPKCLNTHLNRDSVYRKTTPQPFSIQRSSSTANIKPQPENLRRASINSECQIAPTYIDTESSSEEDLDRTVIKNKKDLTTTRYNRAFSLRRARLDEPPPPKCPNTPEMRRKFQPNERNERPASVDRKAKLEVQSRYLLNITKAVPKSAPPKTDLSKSAQKVPMSKPPLGKQVFSRTDSGRYSLRSPKPSSAPLNVKPNFRREPPGKKIV